MAKFWQNSVDRFCAQYFQVQEPLQFPDGDVLKLEDVQEYLHERLFADEVVYQPHVKYRISTLKRITSLIESSIDDWDQYTISDDLMAALSLALAEPLPDEFEYAQRKSYVSYTLSYLQPAVPNPTITFLENRSIIGGFGTTGLRTWEAALHMGQFLCQNPDLVAKRRVLELGAGTGYLSILCAKYLQSAHVIATDGSEDVVAALPENFFLNGLQDSSSLQPMELKWGHALLGTEDAKWNGGRPLDVVIGADITYDQSVLPWLVSTLEELFDLYPAVEVYISATRRSQATLDKFVSSCEIRKISPRNLDYPLIPKSEQQGPFYPDEVDILIYKITKTT